MKRRQFIHYTGAGLVTTLAACTANSSETPDGALLEDALGLDSDPNIDAPLGQCTTTGNDALGPFHADNAPMRTNIAGPDEVGDRLRIEGRLVSASDCTQGIGGVLVDVWQANTNGDYYDAGIDFPLRGQMLTDDDGGFVLDTIRPGHYSLGGSLRPAHIHFILSKFGYATVTTQLYFAGDPYLAPNDPCTDCASDEADRIVTLTQTPDLLVGQWRAVLSAT